MTPLGLPMPMAWAYFLAGLEFFGGAALAVGFLTRPIALMLTVEFIVITVWHSGNGYSFASPHGGYEYPLLLWFIYAADLLSRRRTLLDRPDDRQGILNKKSSRVVGRAAPQSSSAPRSASYFTVRQDADQMSGSGPERRLLRDSNTSGIGGRAEVADTRSKRRR